MENENTGTETGESLFIVRQPVFDRDKNIWAYELMYHGDPGTYSPENAGTATLDTLLSNGPEILGESGDEKKTLISFCCDAWGATGPALSSNGGHIIGLMPPASSADQAEAAARAIKENGSMFMVDAGFSSEVFEMLRPHADIIKVSMKGLTPRQVITLCARLKQHGCPLLATNIESWEDYQGTRALGFDYFQGPFFTRPAITPEEELHASSMAKMQLIKELNNPESDMESLGTIISTDVSLSYRLLKYINSAAFGLPNKIKSLQQAASLLGLKEIRRWAMVVIISDMDTSPKGEELAYMALLRARFLEEMADAMPKLNENRQTLFLVGLFSRLDAMLSHNMEDLLKDIPLDQRIKNALCGERGTELGDMLDMIEAAEKADWQTTNTLLAKYDASFTNTGNSYLAASSWAAQQFASIG